MPATFSNYARLVVTLARCMTGSASIFPPGVSYVERALPNLRSSMNSNRKASRCAFPTGNRVLTLRSRLLFNLQSILDTPREAAHEATATSLPVSLHNSFGYRRSEWHVVSHRSEFRFVWRQRNSAVPRASHRAQKPAGNYYEASGGIGVVANTAKAYSSEVTCSVPPSWARRSFLSWIATVVGGELFDS